MSFSVASEQERPRFEPTSPHVLLMSAQVSLASFKSLKTGS